MVFQLDEDKVDTPMVFPWLSIMSVGDVIRSAILKVFEELFEDCRLCKGINFPLIALFRNKDGGKAPKDFCPISLITSVYKI